jgi:predicted Fe-S protein YdhL (DUF1289 family)
MSVESPCIRQCTLDEADICVGCFRSIAEICAWSAMDERAKRETLARCQERRSRRSSSSLRSTPQA